MRFSMIFVKKTLIIPKYGTQGLETTIFDKCENVCVPLKSTVVVNFCCGEFFKVFLTFFVCFWITKYIFQCKKRKKKEKNLNLGEKLLEKLVKCKIFRENANFSLDFPVLAQIYVNLSDFFSRKLQNLLHQSSNPLKNLWKFRKFKKFQIVWAPSLQFQSTLSMDLLVFFM